MNILAIATVVGTLAALIALPFGVFIGRRNRQVPDIRYALDFDTVLDPDDDLLKHNLSLAIEGRPIKSLSRTRVAFWNHRGDTVRGADIVESDPIRIELNENDEPLQVRRLSSSRQQIELAAKADPHDSRSVYITFDFLDAKDGGIFEIIHQGDIPNLLGTIRGATKRDHGPSDLSSATIKLIGERSVARRLRIRAKGAGTFFSGLVFLALILWGSSYFDTKTVGYLVTVSRFNLHSMNGQANFANAVYTSGNPYTDSSIPTFIVVIFLSMACIMMISGTWDFYNASRGRIPRSIITRQE
jgi:hypothetical protein